MTVKKRLTDTATRTYTEKTVASSLSCQRIPLQSSPVKEWGKPKKPEILYSAGVGEREGRDRGDLSVIVIGA